MSIEIELYVECDACGKELEATVTMPRSGKQTIVVEPCQNCMDEAYKDGQDEEKE